MIMNQKNMNKLRIGLVQTKVSSNIEKNIDKTGNLIRKVAEKGASIVCLQELFAVPYFAQKEDKKFFGLAEKIPGRITNFLSKAAKDNKITLVGGSIFEHGEDGRRYNTSLIFDFDGRMIAKYRKIHIPYDPKYYEQYYFSSGNLSYVQAYAGNVRIAPLICYDQWYPEAARINALKGAQIIFYPTAIGWTADMRRNEPFSSNRWENAMRGNASMNGIYVAAVNRVGKESGIDFWGSSFVADPFGEVICRASSTREEVLIADIDLGKISTSQEGWGFIKNRKPSTYAEIVKNHG